MKVEEGEGSFEDIVEQKLEHLSERKRGMLIEILGKFRDILEPKENGKMNCTGLVHHRILVGDVTPINLKPYRTPQALREEMSKQVGKRNYPAIGITMVGALCLGEKESSGRKTNRI